MGEFITPMIYEELKNPYLNTTKIGQRAFNLLDTESILSIILDEGTFWFEWVRYPQKTDQRAVDWLIRYLKRRGYKYLYEGVIA